MRKRQLTIMSVALIAVAVLITSLSFRQQAQDRSKIQQDEPTVIQEGVMTDRQMVHSSLYKGLGLGVGKKIVDILKTQDGAILEDAPASRIIGGASSSKPTLNERVGRWVCDSDAIITGNVTNKESQLTADGYYVFTDYTINVETVLKNDSKESLHAEGHIIYTGPGGKVLLNSHLVDANFSSMPVLRNGGKYLFFLKAIPTTGAFNAVWSTVPVLATAVKDETAAHQRSLLPSGVDVDAVVPLIKISVSAPCSEGGGK